jgi:hypothetical protein
MAQSGGAAMMAGGRRRRQSVVEIIMELFDDDKVRVIVAALKAHGFHPLESETPGFPGVYNPDGIPIAVPEQEARDAKLLAEALLRDMDG